MRSRLLFAGLAVGVGVGVGAGAGAGDGDGDGSVAVAVSPAVYPAPQGRGTGLWTTAYASAHALAAQMTLEEKVNLTRGFSDKSNTCAGNTGSVPRLGWQGLCLMDAGNGVRATDMVSAWASGLHVGAAWDRNLTYQRGFWMGREFRAKGVNIALGPNAGPLGRTPLGGRNWEGFSVDPYLSGQLNAETITGMQQAGVMANLKHFIANEQETYRRPYFGIEAASSNVDDKTLHEYYLWPFVDGIRAGAASVMCSYNRVNNTYACESSKLINGVLKGELAYEGFVMLDWNARHTLGSANAGLDMVMPGAGSWGGNLAEAVRNGTVDEKRVTDMATRILAAWYLVGQDKDFPPPGIGMKNLTEPHEPIDARDVRSRPILMEGARAGHVLVKNEKQALPLKKLRMVSVFGYDATVPATKNTDTLFELGYMSSREMAQAVLGREYHFDQAARGGTIVAGGRAGSNAPAWISDPLSAIQQRAEKDNTWVNWDLTSPNPDVNAASQACLVFINAMATEGWDREGLHDDFSDALVRNVAAKCANTVVVVHAAGIRLVDQWIEHANVTAAVLAHLPGQESGAALASLLWGEANFSGKLPYTLARNESDYPVYAPCGRGGDNTTSPQCDYTEGVYLDYRAFDARNVTLRYEFGYGLSYTTFSYSDLVVVLSADRGLGEKSWSSTLSSSSSSSNDTRLWDVVATVQARVRNSGPVAGDEVAQLYLGIPGAPPRQLRGFDKVSLAPGQDAVVRFELTRRDLSEWHVGLQRWVVQEGEYTVFVGASSRDIRLEGVISVKDEQVATK
ncbi:glycoside hydrolase 3 [Claviceps citrina]|nr:glycoside hydrolase 3 [Claviceps citrina]